MRGPRAPKVEDAREADIAQLAVPAAALTHSRLDPRRGQRLEESELTVEHCDQCRRGVADQVFGGRALHRSHIIGDGGRSAFCGDLIELSSHLVVLEQPKVLEHTVGTLLAGLQLLCTFVASRQILLLRFAAHAARRLLAQRWLVCSVRRQGWAAARTKLSAANGGGRPVFAGHRRWTRQPRSLR
jgi:hypothetical protein